MAKKANRKMIGAFVVIAVGILAASIVIFGSGDLFKKKTEYVLYFEGSVKGLNIGSPVLYKGVQVGVVKNIVIRSYVKDLKSYIPVFIEVYPDKFDVVTHGEETTGPEKRIPRLIEIGLRARLVIQSMITGQLLVEVDMHPGTPVNLKNLDEEYEEIPTIPSTLSRLEKSLEKFEFTEINTRLVSILASIDRILNNPNIEASIEEIKGAVQDARGLVNNMDKEVKPLASKAQSTLDNIGKLARDVDVKMDPLSKSVTEALKSADSAFKSINDLVGKRSPTRADLDNTLRELAGAARSLRILAEYLERHPDALIKGKGQKNY